MFKLAFTASTWFLLEEFDAVYPFMKEWAVVELFAVVIPLKVYAPCDLCINVCIQPERKTRKVPCNNLASSISSADEDSVGKEEYGCNCGRGCEGGS